jgi:hypothetical protein
MSLPSTLNLNLDTCRPEAVSLGKEVCRIEPHWRMEQRLMVGFGVAATLVSLAITVMLDSPLLLVDQTAALLMFGLFWQIKPRRMIFCDHGMLLDYRFRAPILLPYASISHGGGGTLTANGRTYQYGINYVEDAEIERCFVAVGRLAYGMGRPSVDRRVVALMGVWLIMLAIPFIASI